MAPKYLNKNAAVSTSNHGINLFLFLTLFRRSNHQVLTCNIPLPKLFHPSGRKSSGRESIWAHNNKAEGHNNAVRHSIAARNKGGNPTCVRVHHLPGQKQNRAEK